MQVKCRACGKKIEKSNAYAVITDKDRRYYCSKEEVDELAARQKIKNDTYDIICDIFGYKVQNSALFKEQKLWKEICDDEKILAYLQENKDYITNAVSRLDSSEFAKIRYFSAILKNSLKDFSVQVRARDAEPVKVEADFEMYEPTVSSKRKRRGLSDIEDEV